VADENHNEPTTPGVIEKKCRERYSRLENGPEISFSEEKRWMALKKRGRYNARRF